MNEPIFKSSDAPGWRWYLRWGCWNLELVDALWAQSVRCQHSQTFRSSLLISTQISPVPCTEFKSFTSLKGYLTWPITCWRENRSNSQTVNSRVLFGRSTGETIKTKSSWNCGLDVLRSTLDWAFRFLSGRRNIFTYGVTVTFSPIGVKRVARMRQTLSSSLNLS